MPKSAKKKRRLPTVSVASLYNEDIGFEGLKKKRVSSTNDISFQLPIDEQEERKRQKRMVGDHSAESVSFPTTVNRNLLVFDLIL